MIVVCMIAFLFYIIGNITSDFIHLYTKKIETALPSASIFSNLSKVVVYVIGLLIILQFLGISITPVLTALGVGGLAVALALQDTLSNVFAGLNIIVSKQINPGNYIKLDMGEEGYVVDITWRNTTLKQLPNNLVVIPNNKLSSAIITNYHLPEKSIISKIPISVSYDSDLTKVEDVTLSVARAVLTEFKMSSTVEPIIRFTEFAEYSINFVTVVQVNEFTDQFLFRHHFIKQLLVEYRKEQIDIPFPTHIIKKSFD